MFPLPFCHFTIETGRAPTDVLARIRARLVLPTPAEGSAFAIEAFFRRIEGQPTPQFFTGSVDEPSLTFRISRYLTYRNSFQPLLFGTARVQGAGTIVHIHARPSWLATVFTVVWLAGVSAALFASGSSGIHWFIRFGMPLFAVFLYFGAFMPELIAARRALSVLIGPDPTQSAPEA